MDRRQWLRAAAGAAAGAALSAARAAAGSAAASGQSALGLVVYVLGRRDRYERSLGRPGLAHPLRLLEAARQLGAGGIQAPLRQLTLAEAAQLRRRAEQWGMFVEGIGSLPADATQIDRFDRELAAAREAGAAVVRVVMLPGRRYERFASLEQFREAVAAGRRSLERAEPIAARRGVVLALENHKDMRTDERLALLERLSSPHIGACVDTGNNLALLEDPLETARALAPWARSVHLKDQAVQEYEDGFLLADAALGEGALPLPAIVDVLRRAQPQVRFFLESITRDPLRVPCLTDAYWATLPDVPGRDLARTLRMVRRRAAKKLTYVDHLPLERQAAIERGVVERSVAYARATLAL